jgi:hypothetical protein
VKNAVKRCGYLFSVKIVKESKNLTMPWSFILPPVILALIYGFRVGRKLKKKKPISRKDLYL